MARSEQAIVDEALLCAWPLPEPGSDKEERGLVLVVGGSRQTPGAVVLAGESSLRVGAGKLQVATAESAAVPVALALPEAAVAGLPEGERGGLAATGAKEVRELADGACVVLLGTGMTDPETAVDLLSQVVPAAGTTVVLDALGSAYLTERPDGVRHLEGRCVLSLNPKEVARTLGADKDEVEEDLRSAARALSERVNAVVLLGGTDKVVADPDGRCWVVEHGGPGLGVSGSGDVQAGLVAGLCARGVEPAQAAVWAAYLHGAAGEALAERIGPVGFLARELPGVVPRLLARLVPR